MITIYDNSLTQLGIVNNYNDFYIKKQLRAKGMFSIRIAKNKPGTDLLQIGNFIKGGQGISGKIVERLTEQDSDGQFLTIKGTTLLSLLNQRVTVEYSGTLSAETLAKKIVNDNCVDAVDTDRNFANMVVDTDTGAGSNITLTTKSDPLIKTLENVLGVDDYGHEIIIEGGQLIYRVIIPTDKTAAVQFSNKVGNINTSKEVLSNSSYKNFMYIEGDGISSTYGTATGFDRKEGYAKDGRISTTAGLTSKALQELNSKYRETVSVDATLRVTNDFFKYDVDYTLGDFVSIVLNDTVYTVQITEYIEQRGANGRGVKLTFGMPRRGVAEIITDLEEKVSNQAMSGSASNLIDGGSASSVYTLQQIIDGGDVNGN